ncbi:MAG TPA: hypothetical protein PLW78_08760 [bacterium]|jgi:hypothetical protein|nr:hypothetical protein [bacterium]HPG34910.1 hypothetical protein [bacterium]HPM45657.1 hypothetical protein [bacterium]HRQ70377.1 hypothetical protein [bacterium]
MSAVKTRIYSSFDEAEAALLHEFKKEAFYFTGEDLKNFNFWQQYFNLFFIYHYDIGEGKTLAEKRELEKASVMLFSPSLFSRLKGEDLFTGEKLVLSEDEENSLTWYKEKEFILSFFHQREDGIHFVESRSALLMHVKAAGFFKKLKKALDEGSYFPSANYILFLLSILMMKKERFASSKLYDPYQFEEIEKLHLYYEKFAKLLI